MMYSKNILFRIVVYDCEINYAYIKSPAKDSVITCDKIINVLAKLYDDTSETVGINSNSNHKIPVYKMGYYTLHTILLVNILLLEILFIWYYFIKG